MLWNTRNHPNSSGNRVYAKAYDFNGNTDIDDYAIDIAINNSGTPPPTPIATPTPLPSGTPGPTPTPAPTPTPTPTPTPGTLPEDINKDGVVNVFDLSILLTNYNKTGSGLSGDITADGVVNIFDLSRLLSKWGA
jgi:hypothetical protein